MKAAVVLIALVVLGSLSWALTAGRSAGPDALIADDAPVRRGRAFNEPPPAEPPPPPPLSKLPAEGPTPAEMEMAKQTSAPAEAGTSMEAKSAVAARLVEASLGAETEPTKESVAEAASGDPRKVEFATLAGFKYLLPEGEVTEATLPDQVPAEILALDGATVGVKGFMIPLMVKSGNEVSSFVLVKDQMSCCYGVAPAMNEWIHVTMPEASPARYLPDLPIVVYGTLHVKEELKRGTVVSLYKIDGTQVDGPREWTKRGF